MTLHTLQIFESILDAPRAGLDSAVWQDSSSSSAKPALSQEAQQKLDKAIGWVQSQYNFSNLSVYVIGSICSNSWAEDSDIDIDFCASGATQDDADEDVVKEFGWAFKKNFIDNYMKQNPDDAKIGSHPLEVYFNPNPFQCFMSVGCYNVLEGKWEVGPELKKEGFDPVSEYYGDAMKQVDKILKDIRLKIFEVYELAFVIKKSSDQSFRDKTFETLSSKIEDISELYKTMKRVRSNFQKPCKSKEEALKRRQDKKQHIVDAAFKFLDKFGYVSIMKDMIQLHDDKKAGAKLSINYIVSQILASVKENMSLKHLQDSEEFEFVARLQEMDQIDESAKSSIASLATIVSLLAIPNVLPAAELQKELAGKNLSTMTVNSPEVKKAMQNAAIKSLTNLNAANAANAVARTIYAEARSEGEVGMKAVASVIWNRAGGKAENLVKVVSKKKQFSCWNKYDGGWDDRSFKFKIPMSVFIPGKNREAWNVCVKLAGDLVSEKFTSTIGNRNIYSSAADNQKAKDTWGKLCDLKIGAHIFGYAKDQDGFRSQKSKKSSSGQYLIYIVKSGDTLGKIAKDNRTTVDTLMKVNNIKDPNKLKIGQKLQIA